MLCLIIDRYFDMLMLCRLDLINFFRIMFLFAILKGVRNKFIVFKTTFKTVFA